MPLFGFSDAAPEHEMKSCDAAVACPFPPPFVPLLRWVVGARGEGGSGAAGRIPDSAFVMWYSRRAPSQSQHATQAALSCLGRCCRARDKSKGCSAVQSLQLLKNR